jgi:hypothetical protein
MNTDISSMANGPMSRDAQITRVVRIAFQIRSARRTKGFKSIDDLERMSFPSGKDLLVKSRAKFRTIPSLAAVLIIATLLFAQSCALAHGGDNRSSWKRCPKARQCPPDTLVEREKIEVNTGWLSTANCPTIRKACTTEAVRLAFQIRPPQTKKLHVE